MSGSSILQTEIPSSFDEVVKNLTFTPEELKKLCEIPCEVRMSDRNRLWKYEQYVIGLVKEKHGAIKEKHIPKIHKKFFRKFDFHYEKQLKSEQHYKETHESRLLWAKLRGAEFLEREDSLNLVNETCTSSLNTQDATLNFEYDIESEEPPVGRNSVVRPKPLPAEKTSNDSSDDLDDFIHQPGANFDSEPVPETAPFVSSQINTQSSTYSQFQSGVIIRSTQQPHSQNF